VFSYNNRIKLECPNGWLENFQPFEN
jgi:hypothetical protein